MRLKALKPHPGQPGVLRTEGFMGTVHSSCAHSCEKETICKARREVNLRTLVFRIVRKRNQWKFLWNFVRVGQKSQLKT